MIFKNDFFSANRLYPAGLQSLKIKEMFTKIMMGVCWQKLKTLMRVYNSFFDGELIPDTVLYLGEHLAASRTSIWSLVSLPSKCFFHMSRCHTCVHVMLQNLPQILAGAPPIPQPNQSPNQSSQSWTCGIGTGVQVFFCTIH